MNFRRCGQYKLLAACDAELLGKKLREGKLLFEVSEEFYKGRRVTLDEAINLIGQSTIVNMIGKRIVKRAIEKGVVHPEAVLRISGVPHAQIVKI